MRDLFQLSWEFSLEVIYADGTDVFSAQLRRSEAGSSTIVQSEMMTSSWTDGQIVSLVGDWSADSLVGNHQRSTVCQFVVAHLTRVRDDRRKFRPS